MFRLALASAFLLGAVSVAGSPLTSVVGRSLAPAPQSRGQAALAIDDTTAAALIGAISSQFGERQVEVHLTQIDVRPAGFAQRDVQGRGQLRIGRDGWIPFRFRSLYDTEQNLAGSPELTLGAAKTDQPLPAAGKLGTSLARAIDQRLHDEFPQQDATVHVANVRAAPVGGSYQRIEADGTVAFGADGTAATRIEGLYDPRHGDWLQLAYELGGETVASSLATR